jgi:hypothetical protein
MTSRLSGRPNRLQRDRTRVAAQRCQINDDADSENDILIVTRSRFSGNINAYRPIVSAPRAIINIPQLRQAEWLRLSHGGTPSTHTHTPPFSRIPTIALHCIAAVFRRIK